MTEQPLVTICIPSTDVVYADFAVALVDMCVFPVPARKMVVNVKVSLITVARNMGVDAARDLGAKWLLFLDSDMIFPADLLARLLAHEKDIVGATYCKRVAPYQTLGVPEDQKAKKFSGGLIKMQRMPTGCLLINMSVFDRLKKPYFRCAYEEESGIVHGEDYVFCDHARNAGYDVWCDVDLSKKIGHIGQQVFRIKQVS